jgi:hypothetical protein
MPKAKCHLEISARPMRLKTNHSFLRLLFVKSIVTVWFQPDTLTLLRSRIPTLLCIPRRLREIIQRHLIIVVRTGIRTRDTLIGASLLHLQAPPATTREISISLSLGLGVPETAFVGFVVRVAPAGTAAYATEPEEERAPGECYCEPGDDEGLSGG